uniref:Uncharacterized protein n=1 Tax=Salix viminalis TaxID=40686 RepID=A0A6N2KYT6_SALVM
MTTAIPSDDSVMTRLLVDYSVNSSRGNPINGSSGFLFFKKHGNLFLYGDSHQRFPVGNLFCSWTSWRSADDQGTGDYSFTLVAHHNSLCKLQEPY